MGGCVPPTSPRSSEDSLRPHAQLRQTFPHRRKMNTEERNSVEKGARRRRAPAPVKLCFAGAGASAQSVPPASPRSPEDSLHPHAQLRQTFSHRRKTNTEEPNSVEKPPRRSRAPAPVKVCFAGAGARWNPYLRRTLIRRRTAYVHMLSSGKHSLTGGRRIPKSPTPSRSPLAGVERDR